jgi:type 2A phosphatase activator TIP41
VDVQTLDLAYDWTFTTQYAGSLSSPSPLSVSECPTPIPLSLLSRPDPILYFCSLTLYEDELHDNGVASCSLKCRVMERCWLVLLTFWLRVDDVCVRVIETRAYCQDMHEQHAVVLREHTEREETFASLIAVRQRSKQRD